MYLFNVSEGINSICTKTATWKREGEPLCYGDQHVTPKLVKYRINKGKKGEIWKKITLYQNKREIKARVEKMKKK